MSFRLKIKTWPSHSGWADISLTVHWVLLSISMAYRTDWKRDFHVQGFEVTCHPLREVVGRCVPNILHAPTRLHGEENQATSSFFFKKENTHNSCNKDLLLLFLVSWLYKKQCWWTKLKFDTNNEILQDSYDTHHQKKQQTNATTHPAVHMHHWKLLLTFFMHPQPLLLRDQSVNAL